MNCSHLFLVIQLLLYFFLLLSGRVLACNGLAARPALRGRENQITGLLDLFQHVNPMFLSFLLGNGGPSSDINVLILQIRDDAVLALSHRPLRWHI